jgi:FtsH-binding integral membrane protein
VYGILAMQLVLSSFFVLLSVYHQPYKTFIETHDAIAGICLTVSIILIYALACYKQVARKVPLNYILLAIFTACEAYTISCITTVYSPEEVAIAACLTAAVTVGLSLYACYKKSEDMTMLGSLLFTVTGVAMVAMILAWIFRSKYLELAICGFCVILWGLWIVYDTQLIVANKDGAYSVDDYIIAAMNLYIDITQLFLEILRLVGSASGD